MKKQTCEHCAYAGHVRNGESGELICANCPVAPGELVRVEPDSTCPNFRVKRCAVHRLPPTPPSALPAPPREDVCYIPLTRNQFAMVDAADYPEISKYRWIALFTTNNIYAVRNKNGRTVYMHREIMQPPPGMVTDHIDRDGRNNCRCNLRNCTHRENTWNSRSPGSSSGFKNVWRGKECQRYCAKIGFNGRYLYLGSFRNAVEAAHARDLKALELYGPYAFINLPQDLEPRPIPPDPNHPERRTGITGLCGYLRCAPYAPLSPPEPGRLTPTGGLNRIVRIAGHALNRAVLSHGGDKRSRGK